MVNEQVFEDQYLDIIEANSQDIKVQGKFPSRLRDVLSDNRDAEEYQEVLTSVLENAFYNALEPKSNDKAKTNATRAFDQICKLVAMDLSREKTDELGAALHRMHATMEILHAGPEKEEASKMYTSAHAAYTTVSDKAPSTVVSRSSSTYGADDEVSNTSYIADKASSRSVSPSTDGGEVSGDLNNTRSDEERKKRNIEKILRSGAQDTLRVPNATPPVQKTTTGRNRGQRFSVN